MGAEVKDGMEVETLQTEKFTVNVDKDGKAHFAITASPVSFGQFARFFRDVAKTPNALYLDGTVSSLWDPARGRMDTRADLGPLVVVETKE